MTKFVLIGASLTAGGHPGECSATVSGSVQGSSSLTVGGTAVATTGSASMEFSSHAHSYSEESGCGSYSSHSIQPSSAGLTSSITVSGSPVYLEGINVATDPGSGGSVNVVSNGGNNSIGKK